MLKIITTTEARAKLNALMAMDYVTMEQHAQIGNLAKIIAKRTGSTRTAVLAAYN